jgi:hypothetical protein
MPEQRARTYHRNRVANTFSEEIGAMLEGELSDPRIAPAYVTRMEELLARTRKRDKKRAEAQTGQPVTAKS